MAPELSCSCQQTPEAPETLTRVALVEVVKTMPFVSSPATKYKVIPNLIGFIRLKQKSYKISSFVRCKNESEKHNSRTWGQVTVLAPMVGKVLKNVGSGEPLSLVSLPVWLKAFLKLF